MGRLRFVPTSNYKYPNSRLIDMSGNTKYVLTGKQKEYLCDHDQPDPKTEEGIEKKFQKVPNRIQQL